VCLTRTIGRQTIKLSKSNEWHLLQQEYKKVRTKHERKKAKAHSNRERRDLPYFVALFIGVIKHTYYVTPTVQSVLPRHPIHQRKNYYDHQVAKAQASVKRAVEGRGDIFSVSRANAIDKSKVELRLLSDRRWG
jgi:hypothetical protein